MIKLYKLEEPDILKKNADEWTQEYLGYIKRNEIIPDKVKKRYNHPEIKAQIIKETHGKCAYCESKITHISPGDIEHILPKNKDAHPELYVTWSNLTFSCESCNRSGKRSYNNDDEPLLNPYTDNIDDEIFSAGPMIFSKGNSRKGRLSIDVLKLNRVELIERRKEAIDKLDLLRARYEAEMNPAYKDILYAEMRAMSNNENEYSFILKGFLKACNIDMNSEQ